MQYWQRRLHRSVTEIRRLRSGRPKASESAIPWILSVLQAGLPGAQVQVPDERPATLRVSPGPREVCGHDGHGIFPDSPEIRADRGPGPQVPHHLVERPVLDHLKSGNRDLDEREIQESVATLDDLPLGRPVGTHDLAVEAADHPVHGLVEVKEVVAPDREDAARN